MARKFLVECSFCKEALAYTRQHNRSVVWKLLYKLVLSLLIPLGIALLEKYVMSVSVLFNVFAGKGRPHIVRGRGTNVNTSAIGELIILIILRPKYCS